MVLPFVIVYIVGFVFVFRSLLAVGVAEHYEAERYDLVRHSEEVFDEADTFADRVAATPDCAEAYGMGGKKDVFGSGRAVLHPIVSAFAFKRIGEVAAYDDRCLGLGCGFPVALGERVERGTFGDDKKFPGLAVARCRSGHAGAEKSVDRSF